ncbi:neutral zinc metallopeptidase [Prevotella sp. P2-180]|uniref:KPN_02809 family neutral zinc metallopeptidase n=1 Tax=Prevotella sp. P2-180 TaxID=2024224 RepID=UPI000B9699B0|nr:neutral zinc metallopeptidase [Prevotella sp. P2-180]MDD6862248.1 neutral zinc metallopeptidase [Prevotella sp.]MDD7224993.1 neutral zinc metallopeptidase [Prevotella sp.]MDY4499106.1 neutral zinc metallopeptidase [Prevotella sp.]OYP62665.1 neutral zinc metallopeptidase [Prevotella sp. P2-180]
MKLDGRRMSDNISDRRGERMSMAGGGLSLLRLLAILPGGIKTKLIGLAVVAAVVVATQGTSGLSGLLGLSGPQTEQRQYQGTPEEQELYEFSAQILAGTEDVWTELFERMGKRYIPPKMVIYKDAVQSGCGNATSSTGPFYCSADQTVYIDLSFFMNMKRQIGADGDFAYAYVIAHEVGHHVQYLLGDLDRIHEKMASASEKESNRLSVRLELQADFYAGIWAYHDNRIFSSLEDGDIDEGLDAARKIGDDYLQKKARGYTVPDSFNHGTSSQRSRWLKLGAHSGDLSLGDTFTPEYSSL